MSNQIQNKLFNYEVKPPEQLWEKIEAALNSDEELLLSRKLFHFQQTPSEQVWENIKTKLIEENKQTPVLPFFKKYRRPLKYVVAAASLIFVVFLTTLLFPRKIVSNTIPIEESYQTAQKELIKIGKDTSAQTVITRPEKTEKARKETMDDARGPLLPAVTSEDNQALALSDRYVVYSNPTGNEVKVSKKLYDLFACSDFEIYCRQHIELLQQKVAASPSMAVTDFNSVVDMLKSLQNNP